MPRLYIIGDAWYNINMETGIFKNKYKTESARRVGHDYTSNGWYFITICTKNMKPFFGNITDGKMRLSEIGKIAEEYWQEIPKHFPFTELNEFIIMPNHIHGIIGINCDRRDEALPRLEHDKHSRRRILPDEAVPRLYGGEHPQMSKISPEPKSLSVIIGSFKSIVTKTIHQKFPNINFAWQSRFYDRIIRNDEELDRVRKYIFDNVLKWEFDRNNPENVDIHTP